MNFYNYWKSRKIIKLLNKFLKSNNKQLKSVVSVIVMIQKILIETK